MDRVIDGRIKGYTIGDYAPLPPVHLQIPVHLRFLSCQEERSRLHAEMAKMQSLEEDALLKGTLAIHDLGRDTGQYSSPSSSPVKPRGSVGSDACMGGGEAQAAGEEGSNRGAACGGRGEDAEEPQTDGDETDDYSDQVLIAPFDGELRLLFPSSLEFRTAPERLTVEAKCNIGRFRTTYGSNVLLLFA